MYIVIYVSKDSKNDQDIGLQNVTLAFVYTFGDAVLCRQKPLLQ